MHRDRVTAPTINDKITIAFSDGAVVLTSPAAILAFIPLTSSVFWGSMAYTLIGGTAVGTVLILLFLPALYATWFRILPPGDETAPATASLPVADPA